MGSTRPRRPISITGDLGSGKTVVSALLTQSLGFDYYSTGRLYRQMAKEMDVSTLELNRLSETDPSIDEKIDGRLLDMSGSQSVIVDSRMAFHFIPDSFKVYLITDPLVAATRVFGDPQRIQEGYNTIEEVRDGLLARRNSENKRYEALYGIDTLDPVNYDLWIDTSRVTPETVAHLIEREYRSGEQMRSAYLQPEELRVSLHVRGLDEERLPTYTKTEKDDYAACSSAPLSVIAAAGNFWVYDGHHRLSACLRNSAPLVTCRIIATDHDEIVPGLTALDYVSENAPDRLQYDWQDYHAYHSV